MELPDITITKVHETVHRVVFDEARLRHIVNEAAAALAGVELGGNVTVRRTMVNPSGAVVGSAFSAIVELVENHTSPDFDFLDAGGGPASCGTTCANCACGRKGMP